MNFGLNGFTEAIIQRATMERALASNLFWINVTGSLVLAIGFAASGSLLASFYKDRRVADVAAAMALTILITGFSVIHLSLLKRAMRFSALSINDIVSKVVSVIVSMALALAGWGYWALVAGAVALQLSLCIGAWALCRWIPGRPHACVGTKSVVRSATNIYGFFNLYYLSRNMDNLLVGWKFGPIILGFYKKAYDLFVLPAGQLLSPISAVALPVLSRLGNEPERRERYLLRSISILAFVGMGIGACLTVIGKDLVVLLLGHKWAQSGKLFAIFGPGIGAMFVYGAWGWIHLSIGRGDRYLRWGIVEIIVTGSLFVVALPWGASGIAAAWTISLWVLIIPAYWYAGRPMQLQVGSVINAIWRYIASAAIAAVGCIWLVRAVPAAELSPGFLGNLARIVAYSLIFGVLYLVLIVALHWGCEPLRQMSGLLRELVPRKNVLRPAPSMATAGAGIETFN